MQTRSLAFIGGGNMSRAIISGLHASQYPMQQVWVSNPGRPKLDALAQDFAVHTTSDNAQAAAQAEVVILAVKPQLMEQVCSALIDKPELSNKLFISLAAGIPVARLRAMLGGISNIVRVMPNTPSAIGLGMSGLYAAPDVSQSDQQFSQQLMQAVGETLQVEQEDDLNTVIAAAGSSPAYFFLFLEAMQQATEACGLSKQQARLLVQQAMLGSAHMVCNNPDLELAELRAQVTSKGGTTAQAIAHFQQHGLQNMVQDAMQAAIIRAEQMANTF